MCDAMDKDGCIRVYRQKLEQIIATPYNRLTKGGIKRWLDDLENAYAGLEEEDVGIYYSPDMKLNNLINNLHLDKEDSYILTSLRRDCTTFDSALRYLREEGSIREH